MAEKQLFGLVRQGAHTFPRSISDLVSQSCAGDPYEGGRLEQLERQVENLCDFTGRLIDRLVARELIDQTDLDEIIFWIGEIKWSEDPYKETL